MAFVSLAIALANNVFPVPEVQLIIPFWYLCSNKRISLWFFKNETISNSAFASSIPASSNEIPVSGRSSKRAGDFLNSLVIVLHQMKNSPNFGRKLNLKNYW
jgi:hypothetical protein